MYARNLPAAHLNPPSRILSRKVARRPWQWARFLVIATLIFATLSTPSSSGISSTTIQLRPPALPMLPAADTLSMSASPDAQPLPFSFEPNAGQANGDTRFIAHANGGTIYFNHDGLALVPFVPASAQDVPGQLPVSEVQLAHQAPAWARPHLLPTPPALTINHMSHTSGRLQPTAEASAYAVGPPSATHPLKITFAGTNTGAEPEGGQQMPGKVNYFRGSDPRYWYVNLPTYGSIAYHSLYPGVDLVYEGTSSSLESTYTITPGGDPSEICWRYDAGPGTRLQLDRQDNLQVQLGIDNGIGDGHDGHDGQIVLTEKAPLAWQEIDGKRIIVDIHYALHRKCNMGMGNDTGIASIGALDDTTVGFDLGSYDRTRPLIIDPYLTYSTYLGKAGGAFNGGHTFALGTAVDPAGNIYLVGRTDTTDFPLYNPLQPASQGGIDAFVTKFNPSGTELIYSTYLGGNGNDYGNAIAVDAQGNAYVAGETGSPNFPLVNPFQSRFAGAFVTKLNPSGDSLVFSTFLGGTGAGEAAYGIALGPDSSVYVTGYTLSSDFPTRNPIQGTLRGIADAFITRFNPAGSDLIYSTYLGGSDSSPGEDEAGTGIAVDGTGNAYIVGRTTSADFPTHNAVQPSYGGAEDAFVVKLNPAGTALVYSTYLGGSGLDIGTAIAAGAGGEAYVIGETLSTDFPIANALQPTPGGYRDAFVTELSSDGTSKVYSTYLGGRYVEYGGGIAVDAAGDAYVTGSTASDNFPTQDPIQAQNAGCYDLFISEFAPGGGSLIFSTYLGGSAADCAAGNDYGYRIAVANGVVYVTGWTSSNNFPNLNAYQPAFYPSQDAYMLKIVPTCPDPHFSDVPQGSTFFPYVKCLSCRGIISGYSDGTFRPNSNVTRSQLAKIVSSAAAFYETRFANDPTCPPDFADVPDQSPFVQYVRRLACRSIVTGYPCGGPGEPCDPYNRPYFRPGGNATRGQISKMVALAKGFTEPHPEQTFEDVPITSTFHVYIEQLASRGAISGYPCGGAGEPCVPPANRPYFRPNNNATRGQVAKITSNIFFPECNQTEKP